MAKKTRVEDIDSNFIINSFRQDDMSIPPEARMNGVESEKQEESEDESPMGKEARKEEEQKTEGMPARRRRSKDREQEYLAAFHKEVDIPARIGKTVYIRKEYHKRIQRILRIIAKDEVSQFSYIDNVLTYHFEHFGEEIKKLYKTTVQYSKNKRQWKRKTTASFTGKHS